MSDYDRRHARTREPEYIEADETYIQRGSGTRDLVIRQRNDDYDDRDYRDRRDYRDDYAPRRARSSHYHGRDYEDDNYRDDYYNERSRGRRSRYEDDYYSDDYDRPPRRERRKSKAGEILEGLGLGGVAAAVTDKIRSRSQSRRRRGSYSDEDRGGRDRGHHNDARKKWQQAAQAAVITGVIEAVRSRKEPGEWTGKKGQRIATAALGAAGIDGFLDRDPERKSKRHIAESVVGGLAAGRLANGPRENSSSRGRSQTRSQSRSRSRSVVDRIRSRSRSILGRGRSESRGRSGDRSGSHLKEVAALGGVAAVGKAIYDRVRSKSRGRLRRDASASSDDSYVPSRRQRYQPGPTTRDGPDAGEAEYDRGRSAEAPAGGAIANRARGNSANSSSSEDTDDLKQKFKKTRGKELLTAALASVATIHAFHGVYSSMEASDKRHAKVASGEMSPETARKLKSKNMLQDAAAVGIAALSLKSAFSEWKEMNEQRREKHEIYARRRKRIKARERRERELRMQGGYGGGGYGTGYGSPQPGAVGQYGGGGPTYEHANPYQSYSNIPPPPVGGPGGRYN